MVTAPGPVFVLGACAAAVVLILELTATTRDSVAGKLAATFLRVLSAALVGVAIGLRASTLAAPAPIALRFAIAAATASVAAWYALTRMRPPVADPTAD